jgi:hypothetical protein
MDTVNTKKRWLTIYWRQQFLTGSHTVTRFANEPVSFLNVNDINDISFLERLTAIIVVSVSVNANSMI